MLRDTVRFQFVHSNFITKRVLGALSKGLAPRQAPGGYYGDPAVRTAVQGVQGAAQQREGNEESDSEGLIPARAPRGVSSI